jgi:two-component system response regulator AlgR
MKILLVDDERPARERLRQLLGDIGSVDIVAEADNGRDALAACERHTPDVVLMDIRMPGMDGVEAARHLAALDTPPAVIFATAYNEYAIEAFDAQAIGYLMKPIRRERLARALRHAQRLTVPQLDTLRERAGDDAPRSHIGARVRDRLRLIPVEDILYLQADQKYVAVGLPDEEVLIDDSLKSLETEFGRDVFFRIHRNALVALAHLRAIEKTRDGSFEALVRGSDKRLAISRRHVPALRKLIRAG